MFLKCHSLLKICILSVVLTQDAEEFESRRSRGTRGFGDGRPPGPGPLAAAEVSELSDEDQVKSQMYPFSMLFPWLWPLRPLFIVTNLMQCFAEDDIWSTSR